MSLRVGYRVRLGELSATEDPRRSDLALRALAVNRGLDAVGGASLDFASAAGAAPSVGDSVRIELSLGGELSPVFSGVVLTVRPSLTGLTVLAADGLSKLGRVLAEGVFEAQSAGDIATELLRIAGVSPGEIAPGPTLPRYTLHRGPRALQHLRALAELCGLDVWVDAEGLVQFAPPKLAEAARSFAWGRELVALSAERSEAAPGGCEVWGEGAASVSGPKRAHWLMTELSSVQASAVIRDQAGALSVAEGDSASAQFLRTGVARTGELAGLLARARAEVRAARPARGSALVLGAPGVEPAMCVAFTDLPEAHVAQKVLPAAVRVRAVQHRLDRASGFTTELSF